MVRPVRAFSHCAFGAIAGAARCSPPVPLNKNRSTPDFRDIGRMGAKRQCVHALHVRRAAAVRGGLG
jgi:hypothetical protein